MIIILILKIKEMLEKLKEHKTKIIIALVVIGAVVAYLQQ